MPAPPLRKLVVIEDGVLLSMSMNQIFLQEFTFLQGLRGASRKPGCGRCGSRAAQTDRVKVFSAAKASLAGLPDDRKKRLKQLLNAEQVKIRFVDGSGKVFERTF